MGRSTSDGQEQQGSTDGPGRPAWWAAPAAGHTYVLVDVDETTAFVSNPRAADLTRKIITAGRVDLLPDGPCLNTWAPRTCRSTATDPAARLRSPIVHLCTTPRAFPHVCRCVRCGHQ